MSTVRLATFSVVRSSTVSLSVSSKLPRRRSRLSNTTLLLTLKIVIVVKWEGGEGLQSETSFWINFQVKLSKEKNHLDGLVFWKLRFNFDQFRIHIVN